ncbi:MAG: hypothetical protein Q3962_07930 [Corynebacterium sp.]|nr:hypothetical protein [Corynebacterium sp.]
MNTPEISRARIFFAQLMPFIQYSALVLMVATIFPPIMSPRLGWCFFILSFAAYCLRYSLVPQPCPLCGKKAAISKWWLLVCAIAIPVFFGLTDYLIVQDAKWYLIILVRGLGAGFLIQLYCSFCQCNDGFISVLDRKSPPISPAAYATLQLLWILIVMWAFVPDVSRLGVVLIIYVIAQVLSAVFDGNVRRYEPSAAEYRDYFSYHYRATMASARRRIAKQRQGDITQPGG